MFHRPRRWIGNNEQRRIGMNIHDAKHLRENKHNKEFKPVCLIIIIRRLANKKYFSTREIKIIKRSTTSCLQLKNKSGTKHELKLEVMNWQCWRALDKSNKTCSSWHSDRMLWLGRWMRSTETRNWHQGDFKGWH